jgi:hypothetical protein
MRSLSVWAYHADFGTLCRNASLDPSNGNRYPAGTTQGQAGWDVAIRFTNLHELATTLGQGVPMPAAFCGNWLQDCEPIRRGEITRLTIMAHGLPGQLAINGRYAEPKLEASNVPAVHDDLHRIGLMTPEADATILLMGCMAGGGPQGTRLLMALSAVWPRRAVVGFSTVGYRHPGMMKRRGEACELPGMRDTDAIHEIYANPASWDGMWSDFVQMPWASETSLHAKVVRDGVVIRYPTGESATLQMMPAPSGLTGPPRKIPLPNPRRGR